MSALILLGFILKITFFGQFGLFISLAKQLRVFPFVSGAASPIFVGGVPVVELFTAPAISSVVVVSVHQPSPPPARAVLSRVFSGQRNDPAPILEVGRDLRRVAADRHHDEGEEGVFQGSAGVGFLDYLHVVNLAETE